MSPRHLQVGLRYVEANPCRAGLVERPEQYRWSSAEAHLLGAKDRSGVLDLGYWERAGGVQTWTELHGRPENWQEVTALRKCTYAGRPFGDRSFVEEMEHRFQRRWSRGSEMPLELANSA
jgi:putative transposase